METMRVGVLYLGSRYWIRPRNSRNGLGIEIWKPNVSKTGSEVALLAWPRHRTEDRVLDQQTCRDEVAAGFVLFSEERREKIEYRQGRLELAPSWNRRMLIGVEPNQKHPPARPKWFLAGSALRVGQPRLTRARRPLGCSCPLIPAGAAARVRGCLPKLPMQAHRPIQIRPRAVRRGSP